MASIFGNERPDFMAQSDAIFKSLRESCEDAMARSGSNGDDWGALKFFPGSEFLPTGHAALDELAYAVQRFDVKAVEAALLKGADPNGSIVNPAGRLGGSPLGKNLTPMRLACSMMIPLGTYRKLVLALARGGGDPGAGAHANAGLFYACEQGAPDVAQMFLDWGADPNGGGLYGGLPLISALEKNNMKCAQLLIARGADVNLRADDEVVAGKTRRKGLTPLMESVVKGRADQVKFLLDAGADPNASVERVGSPLSLALGGAFWVAAQESVCVELLEAGARLGKVPASRKDPDGKKRMLWRLESLKKHPRASAKALAAIDRELAGAPKVKRAPEPLLRMER